MPVNVAFENKGRGAVIRAHGKLMEGEFIAAVEGMYSEVDAARFRYQIVDVCHLEQDEIPVGKLQQLVDINKKAAREIGNILIAVVVVNGLSEALGEAFSRFVRNDDLKVKLFYRMDSARAWIETELQARA